MMLRDHHTIVIVPGLRGHVEDHWQTRFAAKHPGARLVGPLGRDKRDLVGRVADLQRTLEEVDGPVMFLAHSAGCLVTVHWAATHGSQAGHQVCGAILATPPDLARQLPAEYPSLEELRDSGWLPIPQAPLSFRSIVAASSNDTLGDPRLVRAFADAWGSRLVDLGPVGHLNPAAGYGEWSGAETLLDLLGAGLPARTL